MSTIHISNTDKIANVPTFEMRRYLCSPAIYSGLYSAEGMAEYLEIPLFDAKAATQSLLGEGLAQVTTSSSDDGTPVTSFQLTHAGEDLRRATGRKPVARSAADKALKELIMRAEEINSSNDYLRSITHIAVFGSYVSDKNLIGDLDIAYATQKRWPAMDVSQFDRLIKAHYHRINGSSGTSMKVLAFPEYQVEMRMKNRVLMISLQPWYVIQNFLDEQPAFRYALCSVTLQPFPAPKR
jgi:hypothetical protein